MKLAPFLFQDDVARLSTNLEAVQRGNDRIESMAEEKLLDFNKDKSVYLVIGSKKAKKEVLASLRKSPLTLYGENMKEAKTYSYLGEVISENGVADSVRVTVERRVAVAKQTIYEIKHVVNVLPNYFLKKPNLNLPVVDLEILFFLIPVN